MPVMDIFVSHDGDRWTLVATIAYKRPTDKTRFLPAVGVDPPARYVRAEVKESGETVGKAQVTAKSGCAIIHVDPAISSSGPFLVCDSQPQPWQRLRELVKRADD